MLAEIEVTPVERDDRLAGGLVEAVGRGARGSRAHGPISKSGRLPAFLEDLGRAAFERRVSYG
jgi:hypothetical protein